MKTKASVLTLRIPYELKHDIQLAAEQQGVSLNQLALYALTKEIKSMQTYHSMEKYWKGKSPKELKEEFNQVLNKVKENTNTENLPDWDKT